MRFHIRNFKFRYQIWTLFLVIFLILSFGSGVAFYTLSAKNVSDNFKKSAEDSLSQISNSLETRLNIIANRARSMLINNSFVSVLEQFLMDPSARNTVAAQGMVSDYLKDFERGEPLISSAYLYTERGEFDSYIHFRKKNFDFLKSPFYTIYEDESIQPIQWLPPMADIIFTGNKQVIPRLQRFTVGNYKEWLYFIYQIDAENLEKLLMGDKSFFDDIVIIDSQNQQILGTMDVKDCENSRDYLVESSQVFGGCYTVYGIKSRGELLNSLEQLRLGIMSVAALLFLASITIVFFISKHLTDALSRLERSMLCVQNGDLDVRFFYPYKDEVGTLSKSFNYMTDKLQKMIEKQENIIEELRNEKDRVEEAQKQKRRAELKALQAQINPHFLYNTLNTITWQAADKGLDDICLIAGSLGRFFRLSLSKGTEIIFLADETEHVRCYLNIQQIRYQDKLRYSIKAPEWMGKYRVLKLILQPLVENSIYHGIKEKKQGGEIRVTVEKGQKGQTEVLFLKVWDNGAGISKEHLEYMNENLKNCRHSSKDGYGIYNVNERIMLYYGKEFGLSYESTEGQYTCATLTIPVEYREVE